MDVKDKKKKLTLKNFSGGPAAISSSSWIFFLAHSWADFCALAVSSFVKVFPFTASCGVVETFGFSADWLISIDLFFFFSTKTDLLPAPLA